MNNLALGSIMATLAEWVAAGEAAGVDRGTVLDVLANGGGQSLVLSAKQQKLLDRDWSPHFKVETIDKDLGYLLELADDSDLVLPVGDAAKKSFDEAIRHGLGALDFSAVSESVGFLE